MRLPTGVGFCAADQAHPDWFLTDGGGQRFEHSGYQGHWQMDVGNTAYQDAGGDNVIASAKEGGFDEWWLAFGNGDLLPEGAGPRLRLRHGRGRHQPRRQRRGPRRPGRPAPRRAGAVRRVGVPGGHVQLDPATALPTAEGL